MVRDVFVREVGPRDGLQLVQQFMPTETKLRWIRAEAEAGVIDFEVCSFVPPKVIPQFADAKEVAAAAMAIAGIHPMVLVPNLKGAEIGFELGVPMINCIVSVSRTHNEKNVRRTREQSIAGFHEIVARRNGTEAYQGTRIGCGLPTALGCTLEGDVPEAEALSVVEEILAAGPDEITIPDTVGYASPTQVRSLFEKTIALCGDVPVVAHFHDTRGLGL
ncbi:MAG: hydroxymethylglutaryl-CoA lyase, partial [Hyphomicrobiales bacterium]|nr:hydroxymethylglutaryl-CoA lyase [Hyphomicrobiales bacterium]